MGITEAFTGFGFALAGIFAKTMPVKLAFLGIAIFLDAHAVFVTVPLHRELRGQLQETLRERKRTGMRMDDAEMDLSLSGVWITELDFDINPVDLTLTAEQFHRAQDGLDEATQATQPSEEIL